MKTFIARIVVICISSYQLQAQVSFTLSSSLGVGSGPWWVTAADVNGDGKVDLITANYMANTLSVLTNSGSGGFVLASSPTVGNAPWCVTAADVNGDGKVDLISANFGGGSGNTLTVLTNSGSGGFVLASSPVVGSGPVSVTAADVNGDGKVDLICANYSGNSLSVLTNNGSGGFVLAGNYTVGTSPRSVVAADVNRDGKVDLVCANLGGATLSVLTNNGSGGFVTAGTYSVGYQPNAVIAADVNGDGNVDLLCGNYGAGSGNTLSILTNNGSGGFVLASSPVVGSGPVSVTAADVNGDGNVDLICAGIGGTALTVLTNNGSGSFMLASSPSVGSAPYGVTAADVNGDGKLDLISANRDASTLTVLTNTTLFPKSSLPIITAQPAGLTNAAGSAASFSVGATATGTEPARQLSYQWRLTGTNLPAATNNILALPNLTLAQAGTYDVVVSNYLGSVTSSPAVLAVNFILVKVNGQVANGTVSTLAPAQVTISGGYPGGYLFYTLDGSTPTASSTFYNGSFTVTHSVVVQVLSLSSDFSQMAYAAPVNVQIVQLSPLTLSSPGGGSVTANGQVIAPATIYTNGTVVTLAAMPNSGWSFLNWQGNASGTNNPLNITISQTNNIQAVFGTIVATNTLGGGSIVLSQPNPVAYGTVLTASAVPNPGNYFVSWGGAASGTNAPTTITVTNATPNISALFSALPAGEYSLSVIVLGNGSVAISPQKNYYNAGDSVTLRATPTNAATGFYGWAKDATGTTNVLTILMNTNKTVLAYFTGVSAMNLSLFFCPALTINGTVGYSYTIQSTTDLTNPNSWVTLTNLTLTQPVQIWVDTSVNAGSPLNPKYFYRALPQQ